MQALKRFIILSKKGDTVSALSTRVQIKQWNGLVVLTLIKVNQRLRVKWNINWER
jgi:hypothetical protein